MATTKDYYEILGVQRNASPEDIKKAYRKLAREHHPDMVKESDKSAAEKRFKEINEAYQVLSDPQKRKMYDQFGHTGEGFAGQQGGQYGPFSYTYSSSSGNPFGDSNFDPFDIFEDFFGFRGYSSRRPRRGKNLYYEMRIEFKDAVFGIEREINVESGKVKVKIPAGMRDGMEIKFSGKGMPGPEGAPSGDLYITVRLRDVPNFVIMGDDVLVSKEINMVEAALGIVIDVPTVDLSDKDGVGKTKLKVPGGTQYGSRFLIRNKGMPKLHGRGQGKVIVQVLVKIPQRLNKKQRDLLEKLLEEK
ncbi:MAG: DnaJ C-terminal domain-containing protein [Patescibacteria group bacterium]